MRYLRVLVVLVLCGLPVKSQAQTVVGIPVYDLANHIVNTVTSIESYITTVQAILLVADSVTNLISGGTVTTDAGFLADLVALQSLLVEAEGLSYDIQSLERQIGTFLALESAPDSTRAVRERLTELRRVRSQAYIYALRVQTLIQTATRIVDRIVRIVEKLAEVIGNLAGHEKKSDQVAQLNQIQLIHNTTVQSFERAETVSRAEEVLIEESVERINEQLIADWPRR